jgi:hypothetical protein
MLKYVKFLKTTDSKKCGHFYKFKKSNVWKFLCQKGGHVQGKSGPRLVCKINY